MAAKANALGDFLRARRDQVRPEDVGLVPGGQRRAPGLRREELAMLAGISAEYYLRLERGRAQHPSPQILDALARALQLDAKATRYLHNLAAPTRGDTSELEAAAHGLAEVIDQFLMPADCGQQVPRCPGGKSNRPRAVTRVHAGTKLPALALYWTPPPGELYVDWDEATEIAVSGLRELSGACPKDRRMQALIAELSDASPRFRELWDRAEVGYRLGIQHMRHPQVGELYLCRHRLNAPYPGGDHVLMYRAEPGSPSAMALEELRSLSMRELDRLGLS